MELKKNDKVIVTFEGDKKAHGIVVGDPYRMFTEGESYVEVYLPIMDLEAPIKLSRIEKLGDF
ncbi:MAG: hypothetical protein ACRCX2_38035 [Paraclostridium sp.]